MSGAPFADARARCCRTRRGSSRAPATTRWCSPRPGVPTGMLFVRSLNGGVSHSPDELTSDEDIALAVDVLTGALDALTAREP